jgi:NCS2 family nucleobase:cation symporter-2
VAEHPAQRRGHRRVRRAGRAAGLALAPTLPNPRYAPLSGIGVSAIVLVTILLVAKFAKGFLANISVLVGIVVGGIVAAARA